MLLLFAQGLYSWSRILGRLAEPARNPGLNDDSVVTEKQQEVSSSNGNIEQVKKVTQPPNHQVRWKDVVEYNGTIVAMQYPSKQ